MPQNSVTVQNNIGKRVGDWLEYSITRCIVHLCNVGLWSRARLSDTIITFSGLGPLIFLSFA